MEAPLRPKTTEELCAIVAESMATRRPLQAVGSGSKAHLGKPNRVSTAVDMHGFTGILEYDPAELVMTVGAGTPLSDIEACLEENGQMLAFEPTSDRACTIGGIVAANVAGPRRLSAGSPRDHLLGFEAVSGRAEFFKAGGKVVKNVTGYDLPKLMAGSWGQLAIMTQLTLKVLPRPATSVTMTIANLDDTRAIGAMARAMASTAVVSAAAHMPHGIWRDQPITALRLEGFESSIPARIATLESVLGPQARMDKLSAEEASKLWNDVNSGRLLQVEPHTGTIWRIHCAPTVAHTITAKLGETVRAFYDWAGGLIWLRRPEDADSHHVRQCAEAVGGHAILMRAPDHLRNLVPALHPEPPLVAALRGRIKAAFDPENILDPERFSVSAR